MLLFLHWWCCTIYIYIYIYIIVLYYLVYYIMNYYHQFIPQTPSLVRETPVCSLEWLKVTGASSVPIILDPVVSFLSPQFEFIVLEASLPSQRKQHEGTSQFIHGRTKETVHLILISYFLSRPTEGDICTVSSSISSWLAALWEPPRDYITAEPRESVTERICVAVFVRLKNLADQPETLENPRQIEGGRKGWERGLRKDGKEEEKMTKQHTRGWGERDDHRTGGERKTEWVVMEGEWVIPG